MSTAPAMGPESDTWADILTFYTSLPPKFRCYDYTLVSGEVRIPAGTERQVV
jgi:hypothetical protein